MPLIQNSIAEIIVNKMFKSYLILFMITYPAPTHNFDTLTHISYCFEPEKWRIHKSNRTKEITHTQYNRGFLHKSQVFTFLGALPVNSRFSLKHISYVSTITIMDVLKQENRPSGNL